jgi:hypothetical protein
MTHPLLIALATSLAATLAVHLGLPEAVVGVLRRIAQCAKCSAFWITLTVLLTTSHPPLLSAGLSLAASYLTHWYAFIFQILQRLYDYLWRKLNPNK